MAMKIIAYVICGFGLLGSVIMIGEGDVATGVLGAGVYGFFLAFAIKK